MTETADVIVIGGGLHGCSTALHLALRGARVTLLEKDYPGRHASGVNAGGVRQLARDVAEVPISVFSMALWERIVDLVDDDCGFASHGQVLVAESTEELDALRTLGMFLHRLSGSIVVPAKAGTQRLSTNDTGGRSSKLRPSASFSRFRGNDTYSVRETSTIS